MALCKLLKEQPGQFKRGADHVAWPDFYPALVTHTEFESLYYETVRGEKVAYFHTPEAFMLGDPVRTAKGPEVNTSHVLLTLDDKLSKKDTSFKKGNAVFYLKQNPVQFGKGKAYLISLHSSHFDTYFVPERSKRQDRGGE